MKGEEQDVCGKVRGIENQIKVIKVKEKKKGYREKREEEEEKR